MLILCFNTLLLAGSDISGIRMPENIPDNVYEEATEMVRGFQEADMKSVEAFARRERQKEVERLAEEPPAERTKAGIYYLISFSMPEKTIENIIFGALKENRKAKGTVTVVLKGFKKNSLRETIAHLAELQKFFKCDLPLTLMPELFEHYQVEKVPFIVRKDGAGLIKGDVSVEYAVSKLSESPDEHGVSGRLYAVEETSLKDLAAKKQEQIRKHVVDNVKKMLNVAGFEGRIEKAKKDNAYYVDPSYTLEQDIRDNEGRTVIEKGTEINPADYAPLGKYVVIDGNDAQQVRFAMDQKPRQIIIVSGNIAELSKKYGIRFFRADEHLVAAFHIKRVPAIIEQHGRHIRVTEKAL